MQTDMYICKLSPTHPLPSFPLSSLLFDPHPHLCTSTHVYFRSPASPWMVFLMRSSMVVSHWSRRDTESNSFTASVNASLFCSSWASRSFCGDKDRRRQSQLQAHWLSFAEFLTYFDETMMKTKEVKEGDRKKNV